MDSTHSIEIVSCMFCVGRHFLLSFLQFLCIMVDIFFMNSHGVRTSSVGLMFGIGAGYPHFAVFCRVGLFCYFYLCFLSRCAKGWMGGWAALAVKMPTIRQHLKFSFPSAYGCCIFWMRDARVILVLRTY